MGIGVVPHKAMKKRRVKLLLCSRTRQSKEKSLINLPVNVVLEYISILSLHYIVEVTTGYKYGVFFCIFILNYTFSTQ